MDFELSDEQRGLQDSTRRLLTAQAPLTRTRELADAGTGFDASLWRRGADLGWPALAIAEADGGLGQQLADLVVVCIEHGRCVLPSPLIPTAIVADAIARDGSAEQRGAVLPALLDGTATAAWAFAELGRSWTADAMTATATRTPDGYLLTGAKASVQDATAAAWLLVEAVLAGSPARFLFPAGTAGVQIVRQQSLDVTRELCDVTLTGVTVPWSALLAEGDGAARSITASKHMAAVLASAELVGLGERMLELTVEYAKIREQFGRAIGSFQAVKHKCATMRIWLQGATAATYYAAMAVGEQTADAARAVSVAKSYASDVISQLAGEALQVHGGIGFTWEHDLHLFMRRTRTNALLFGDLAHHRELLFQSLEQFGAGTAWAQGAPTTIGRPG